MCYLSGWGCDEFGENNKNNNIIKDCGKKKIISNQEQKNIFIGSQQQIK